VEIPCTQDQIGSSVTQSCVKFETMRVNCSPILCWLTYAKSTNIISHVVMKWPKWLVWGYSKVVFIHMYSTYLQNTVT